VINEICGITDVHDPSRWVINKSQVSLSWLALRGFLASCTSNMCFRSVSVVPMLACSTPVNFLTINFFYLGIAWARGSKMSVLTLWTIAMSLTIATGRTGLSVLLTTTLLVLQLWTLLLPMISRSIFKTWFVLISASKSWLHQCHELCASESFLFNNVRSMHTE
jgi:hypothetical protein